MGKFHKHNKKYWLLKTNYKPKNVFTLFYYVELFWVPWTI